MHAKTIFFDGIFIDQFFIINNWRSDLIKALYIESTGNLTLSFKPHQILAITGPSSDAKAKHSKMLVSDRQDHVWTSSPMVNFASTLQEYQICVVQCCIMHDIVHEEWHYLTIYLPRLLHLWYEREEGSYICTPPPSMHASRPHDGLHECLASRLPLFLPRMNGCT
jgi:hypothetical protein